MHKVHRLTRLSSVLALLVFSSLSFAQTPEIRGPIETSPSVVLEGSLNPRVRTAEDLGPLAPDTPIHGVTLAFKRSPGQEADLQQLLSQQTSPSSSLYHHWLTPGEFATRFASPTPTSPSPKPGSSLMASPSTASLAAATTSPSPEPPRRSSKLSEPSSTASARTASSTSLPHPRFCCRPVSRR
jgi:Pro-kumamolisin, activation domain